ncbi:MAG: substrate-binding domain-containing protein, partial [Oceanospirillaceae bacterium]|nr:substrate-binding domain-containing protein [Oceanospirillaceae bacterium]
MKLKTTKLLKAMAVAAAMTATMISGVAYADNIRIAYTGYSTDQPFWVGVGEAAKNKAAELGVEFIDLTATQADAAAQKDAVDRALNMGVSGIIIGSVDNRAFGSSLDMAAKKGIPVVTVDTAIDHAHIKSLVQTDNLAAAALAGDYIVSQVKEGTVMILGSAPEYPHGTIDPIADLGQVALEHEVALHVDACLGGFILPWGEALGYEIPRFDFRLPGVTTISADSHKYGYAPKGSSVLA